MVLKSFASGHSNCSHWLQLPKHNLQHVSPTELKSGKDDKAHEKAQRQLIHFSASPMWNRPTARPQRSTTPNVLAVLNWMHKIQWKQGCVTNFPETQNSSHRHLAHNDIRKFTASEPINFISTRPKSFCTNLTNPICIKPAPFYWRINTAFRSLPG